jgi:hypothetical protein
VRSRARASSRVLRAAASHGDDKSLLLSVRGSGDDLSRGSSSFLLAAAAAYCSLTERFEVLPDMVGKTVVGGGKP